MSDQPHTSANLFGRTATIAAPLALLIGSTCYFAGTIYQKRLLSEYGFGGGTIQSSLQAVIAQGYMAVLASIVFATIPTFVGMAIAMSFRRGRSVVHISGRAIMRPRNFAQLGIWIYLAFAMAGLGYISGNLGALRTTLLINSRIHDHCRTCFLYKTSRGQVVALPLAQDERVTLLATRRGSVLLPAGSIRAVRPISTGERYYLSRSALNFLN
jgi:hypothetical protein